MSCQPNCQASWLAAPRPRSSSSLVTFLLVAFAPSALGAPHSSVTRRDGSGGGSVKIWVPILVVVLVVLFIMVVVFRKKVASGLSHITFNSVLAPRPPRAAPTTGVRELTAETLAGPAAVAATRPAARTRRNRRTPSQISTKSLPAYNKEPGEHELVIIQGSDDMEDVPISNVIMPAVAEDDSESMRTHSRNVSEVSSYVQVSDNHHVGTPLLQADEINDNQNETANASSQTNASATDDSRAALLSNVSPDPNQTDPRGEAPAYVEVEANAADDTIQRSIHDLSRVETTDTLPPAPVSSPPVAEDLPASPVDVESGTGSTRRRSVFRGIFSVLAPRTAPLPSTTPAQTQSTPRHTREISHPSVNAPAQPRPSGLSSRTGARSPPTHRPSHSGSTSVFSITSSAFGRTVSRTRSRSNSNFQGAAATNPASASNISINSISAPLTHTLVRTDFVYPRSGPTPEQLKMLSSREAVGKFGVPYGADARAFAASASRVNLQGPPPEFEERQSIDGLPRPSFDGLPRTSGERSRTPSRLAGNRATPSPHATPDTSLSSDSPEVSTSSSAGPSGSHSTEPTEDLANASPPMSLASSPDVSFDDDHKSPIEPTNPTNPTPRPPSPAVSNSSVSTTTQIPVPPPVSIPPLPKKPLATPLSAAPTAFRMPATPVSGARSESRASSVLSFATAESSFTTEALTPSTPDIRISTGSARGPSPASDADGDEAVSATTPKATRGGLGSDEPRGDAAGR